MTIRVNFFLNGLGYGGTEKTAYLFAANLDCKVKVFTYEDADLTRLPQFRNVCEVGFINRKKPNWKDLEGCDILFHPKI